MKCAHCGKEIPDQSGFCPYCGGKQNQNNSENPSDQTAANKTQTKPQTPSDTVKSHIASGKSHRQIWAIAAVILLILIVGTAVTHRKTKINLDKYVTISFDGYDTKGTATYTFDSAKFEKAYGKKLKLNKKAAKKWLKKNGSSDELSDFLGEDIDDLIADASMKKGTDAIEDTLDYTISPDTDLSNGDTVTFSWDMSEGSIDMLETFYNCSLKIDDISETVSGLKEAETFDPFDGASVSYSGIAPDGKIENITAGSDAACQDLTYRADKTESLSNGDTITVTVTVNGVDPTDYCLQNYGKIPSETTKEFKVSGLSSYVTDVSQISDDLMKQMQSQAEDQFNDQFAEMDDDTATVTNLQYIGNDFLNLKEGLHRDDKNIIYLIYKVRVNLNYSNPESKTKKTYNENQDYYWYCSFPNIQSDENGKTVVDLTRGVIPDNSSWYGVLFKVDSGVENPDNFNRPKVWKLCGYEKLDKLKTVAIDLNQSEYNIEDNAKDVDFDASDDANADSAEAETEVSAE